MATEEISEVCSECQTIIGSNDVPFIWRGNVVCGACLRKFKTGSSGGTAPAMPALARERIPNYRGLQALAVLFRAAGLATVMLVVIFMGTAVTKPGPEVLALALGGAISGIVQIGMGEALLCLRDIAINSFHIRAKG